VLVAIGVGVAMFVLRFALLAVLLVAASPHAIPNAPTARTAVSANFFISLIDLLSSSKSQFTYLLRTAAAALPQPQRCLEQTTL
jgi:hypothetical protein